MRLTLFIVITHSIAALISCKDGFFSDTPKPTLTPIAINQKPAVENTNGPSVWSNLPKYCGTNGTYREGLCIENTVALGPFTTAMRELCKAKISADVCSGNRWPIEIARYVRGNAPCPAGTTFNAAGMCEDNSMVYGPFAIVLVNACKRSGERTCDDLQWSSKAASSFIDTVLSQNPVATSTVSATPTAIAKQTTVPVTPLPTTSPPQPIPPPDLSSGIRYCEYTWEEKPGYADYTTINWYERSGGGEYSRKFDRSQGQTLQGSGILENMSRCERARYLLPCFLKAERVDRNGNATRMAEWADRYGYDYTLMRMAFAVQETDIGAAHDNCYKSSCFGIGILQIIDAFAANGEHLGSTDTRWDGISYNVLTNLNYSARIMQRKVDAIGGSGDLSTLARAYNSNPNLSIRNAYGANVPKWYAQLKSCGIK